MAVVTFTVDHLEHDGSVIATFSPHNLRWRYQMGAFGPGWIYYEIPWSDPGLTTDGWAAKRTDWQLNVLLDGAPFPIMAGVHGPNSINTDGNVVKVTGHDWLAWLDQPFLGFDYTLGFAAFLATSGDSELVRHWADASGDTQEDVVDGLLAPLFDDPAEQLILTPVFLGTAWLQGLDYRVFRGDSTTVLQHMAAISDLADPFGFDFWTTYDKLIYMTGPRVNSPSSVSSIYSLTGPSNGIVGIPGWENRGPTAATSIAIASGVGNASRFSLKTYAPSRTTYRDWTVIRSLNRASSDLTSEDGVGYFAEGGGYQDRHPQKVLPLTIRPEVVDPSDPTAMFFNQLGQTLNVDYTFPAYHRVDADFWITGQEFYSDGANNWLCDLSLDQVYN